MKAETVAVVERERESYVLVNSVALVFVPKFKIYYVKLRAYQNKKMRSFCMLFSKNFTSGYVWNIRIDYSLIVEVIILIQTIVTIC